MESVVANTHQEALFTYELIVAVIEEHERYMLATTVVKELQRLIEEMSASRKHIRI